MSRPASAVSKGRGRTWLMTAGVVDVPRDFTGSGSGDKEFPEELCSTWLNDGSWIGLGDAGLNAGKVTEPKSCSEV